MGEMIKPKRPKLKKPKTPSKPREPAKYMGKTLCYINSDSYGNRLTARASHGLKKEITLEGGGFKVTIPKNNHRGLLYISHKNPAYEADQNKYQEKMVAYHDKMRQLKPEIDKYEAALADYEYELALYEMQKKEKALVKAKSKLTG